MAVISGWVTPEELDKIQQAGYGLVVQHGLGGHKESRVDVQVDCNVTDLLILDGYDVDPKADVRKLLALLNEAAPCVDYYEEAEAEERRLEARHNRLQGLSTEKRPPLDLWKRINAALNELEPHYKEEK